MTYEQFRKFYSVYTLWVATGKRFLISELMEEPDEPWAVILEIDKVLSILEEMREQ